jgi:glycosyltransferase involved in cell wall biosynthesis
MTALRPVAVSVLIPVGKRHHPQMQQLYAEYRVGLEALGVPYECIFVLDGQRDDAGEQLRALAAQAPEVKFVSLTRPFGEATALMVGFEQAQGDVIVTLPAHFQVDSAEIPKLVAGLQSADVIVGLRWPRSGGWLERLRRDLFHRTVAMVTGVRFNDLGCGARAMNRRVLEEISLYGDQHRFLPLLADRQGFRTAEVRVKQSSLDQFSGHYPAREYLHRFLDVFSMFFLVRFTKKPLRFFGMIGASTFAIGAVVTAWIAAERIFLHKPLSERPAFLLSSLFIVLGLQLFALGLLGELIIFTRARDRREYQVAEIVQFPAVSDESEPSTVSAGRPREPAL